MLYTYNIYIYMLYTYIHIYIYVNIYGQSESKPCKSHLASTALNQVGDHLLILTAAVFQPLQVGDGGIQPFQADFNPKSPCQTHVLDKG